MFPDLVVVRQAAGGYRFDILEPHDPSLADNFEKAVGLACALPNGMGICSTESS